MSVEDKILGLLDDNLDILPGEEPSGEREVSDSEPAGEPEEKPDEESEEEPDEEPDEEPEKKSDEESEEEETPDIQTMADLAAEFEVSEEELTNHLQIPLTDGTRVPLKDVISAYIDAPEAARIAHEVETERAELATRKEAITKREDEGLQQLAALSDVLLKEIEGDTTDWKRLEEEDKILYLTKRDEYARKRQAIGQALTRIRGYDTEQTTAENEARKTFGREQARLVAKAHPAWVSPQTGEATEAGIAAAKQIDTFLISLGYDQKEIDEDLVDHRQIEAVWKASEYDRLRAKQFQLKKKLRTKTKRKTLTARSTRDDTGKAKSHSQSLRRRLAKTGSEEDAARAIEDSIDL